MSGPKGHIEKRRADGNLVTSDRLDQQRIKRADKNRRCGCRQEQIIQHQSTFPRNGMEQTAGGQRIGADRKQRQGTADKHYQDCQDEHATARIGGKCMHRRQNT